MLHGRATSAVIKMSSVGGFCHLLSFHFTPIYSPLMRLSPMLTVTLFYIHRVYIFLFRNSPHIQCVFSSISIISQTHSCRLCNVYLTCNASPVYFSPSLFYYISDKTFDSYRACIHNELDGQKKRNVEESAKQEKKTSCYYFVAKAINLSQINK